MKQIIYVLVFLFMVFQLSPFYAAAADDARMMKAKGIADEITGLRSTLAASLAESGKTVSPEVFENVCGSVKKRAMTIAKKEGVKIRHAAIKNRNPDHGATADEVKFHDFFTSNSKTEGLWNLVEIEGSRYDRYVKPIYIEAACLACHGDKEKRPSFIKKKYPEDKAFNFKEGDLRGIIEVMIPQ